MNGDVRLDYDVFEDQCNNVMNTMEDLNKTLNTINSAMDEAINTGKNSNWARVDREQWDELHTAVLSDFDQLNNLMTNAKDAKTATRITEEENTGI